jgi:hypothetical protein
MSNQVSAGATIIFQNNTAKLANAEVVVPEKSSSKEQLKGRLLIS